MLLNVRVTVKNLLLFSILLLLFSCDKTAGKTVKIEYQLETSDITADHFFVTYLNERADTVVQHQHYGWKYSFNTPQPFNAYLAAEVYPIDSYVFTIKILIDGQVVRQDSASTASGARKTIRLAYTAN